MRAIDAALVPVKHLLGIIRWGHRVEPGDLPLGRGPDVRDKFRVILPEIVVPENQVNAAPLVKLHLPIGPQHLPQIGHARTGQQERPVHLFRIAIQREVAATEDFVVVRQNVLGQKFPQVSKDDINVAMPPKIEAREEVVKHQPEGDFKLNGTAVHLQPAEIAAQLLGKPGGQFRQGGLVKPHIRRRIFGGGTVRDNQPVNVRIATARTEDAVEIGGVFPHPNSHETDGTARWLCVGHDQTLRHRLKAASRPSRAQTMP